jgi:hypothetical protein
MSQVRHKMFYETPLPKNKKNKSKFSETILLEETCICTRVFLKTLYMA